MPALVAHERIGLHGKDPLSPLFVGERAPQHERPERPRGALGALVGRLFVDVELVHRCGALAMSRAEAVGAGVATADDDHRLARGVDRGPVEQPRLHPVRGDEVLHGQVDATQVPARDVELPLPEGADRQYDGIVAGAQVLHRKVNADVDPALEDRPLCLHLRRPGGPGGPCPS